MEIADYERLFLIERTLDHRYVVSKATLYQTNDSRECKPIIKQFYNIFGQLVTQKYDRTLYIQEYRIKSGEAQSTAMSYVDCIRFSERFGLNLFKGELHQCLFVTYFRR